MEIKTIRGIQFYFSLIFISLLLVGLGTMLTWFALDTETYYMLFIVLIFMILLAYIVVQMPKQSPIVRMSDEGIRYRGRWYGWTQITSVDFAGQKSFPAITLTFDDGNKLCMYKKMYANSREVRDYLRSRISTGPHIQPEMVDEVVAKALKKKLNRFAWIGSVSILLLSFLAVFFNLSKGVTFVIMGFFSIFLVLGFMKVLGKKDQAQ